MVGSDFWASHYFLRIEREALVAPHQVGGRVVKQLPFSGGVGMDWGQ